MIEPISITGGSPTNAPPLIFLIIVSMIKDCFEDSRRRKSDSMENNRDAVLIEAQTPNAADFALLEEKKIEERKSWNNEGDPDEIGRNLIYN